VARADLAPDGTCTLRLPRPGVYDIGAVGGGEFLWALVEGVATRTTASVEVRMPEAAAVKFILDPPALSAQGDQEVVADEGQVVADPPGRGAVPAAAATLDPATLPATWRARPDVRLRIRRGTDAFFITPERFSAPATVTVAAPKWGGYHLFINADPPDA